MSRGHSIEIKLRTINYSRIQANFIFYKQHVKPLRVLVRLSRFVIFYQSYETFQIDEQKGAIKMVKQAKLDFNKPMIRELIIRVIDKEMGMKKQPAERDLALNYMTQMVEQGYIITNNPAERYTIQEIMDMTYAYLDGYNDAMKSLEKSFKKLVESTNMPLV
jgi:hypothetical protein